MDDTDGKGWTKEGDCQRLNPYIAKKSMSLFSLFNRSLSSSDLQLEKAKDYRNVVIIQILIIVFGLTLSGPLLEDSRSETSKE